MNFTPLKNFFDEDLRSSYCVGLNYTVRPGDDLLAIKVEEWLKADMVREGTASATEPAAGEAKVTGVGKVE